MASSLYDDLDVLDGTPLPQEPSNGSTTPPLVGLRVAASWNVTSDSSGRDSSAIPAAYGQSSTSMKMMQSHMAAKRAQGKRQAAENSSWNQRPTVAPVADLKTRSSGSYEGSYRFNQMTGKMERLTSAIWASNRLSTPAMTSGGLMFGEPSLPLPGVVDEYHPLVPNDFEDLVRIKRERRRAEEAAIAASRDYRHAEVSSDLGALGALAGMSRRPDYSDDEENEDEDLDGVITAASGRSGGGGGKRRRKGGSTPSTSRGAAIAPPSSLMEDVTVAPVTTTTTDMDLSVGPEEADADVPTSKFGINSVAAKMMARMGYREGQGLGREGQGMSTALMVEKTSRRGGKIIHERDQQRQAAAIPAKPAPLAPESVVEDTFVNLPLPEHRSCVILLQNMCGPGEVDDDLEPETAEECAKYGKVVACMIFELQDVSDDEAVRIFVEFDSEEAATKAILDLNGRYFAGRVVRAGFYDAEKFRNLELGDAPLNGS